MKPRLEICPTALPGFLKVSASVGDLDVRLAGWNDEMPVLQLEEAGIVLELEFFDRRGLERLARRLCGLAGFEVTRAPTPEPGLESAEQSKRRRGSRVLKAAGSPGVTANTVETSRSSHRGKTSKPKQTER